MRGRDRRNSGEFVIKNQTTASAVMRCACKNSGAGQLVIVRTLIAQAAIQVSRHQARDYGCDSLRQKRRGALVIYVNGGQPGSCNVTGVECSVYEIEYKSIDDVNVTDFWILLTIHRRTANVLKRRMK